MTEPRPIGQHDVWPVAPSQEVQQDHDNPVAYDCANCALRVEGSEHAVGYVLHNHPCPIVNWEKKVGLDGESP